MDQFHCDPQARGHHKNDPQAGLIKKCEKKFITLKNIYVCTYLGSSTETVAFQVYEILKIDHEFLQFFLLGSKI